MSLEQLNGLLRAGKAHKDFLPDMYQMNFRLTSECGVWRGGSSRGEGSGGALVTCADGKAGQGATQPPRPAQACPPLRADALVVTCELILDVLRSRRKE